MAFLLINVRILSNNHNACYENRGLVLDKSLSSKT
jgi:hypothetical protein